MEERRQETRIHTSLNVLASSPRLCASALITNISATGAFIATDRLLSEDSSLAIDIQLPGDTGRITINARVVWAKNHGNATSAGMGIEFTDILDRDRYRLVDFINRHIR
jgi:uncharacterized protein (TIGR02266 family)